MESFVSNASSLELAVVPTEATCNLTSFKSFQWPKTPVGTFAKVPCPASVMGVSLKPGDVKHFCGLDGQWALQVDFSACFPEDQPQSQFGSIQLVIYMVGFTSSLVAMTVALIIFLYCRCLKCMRNKLHMQLILTFVLKNIFWIIVRFTLENLSNIDNYLVVCKVVIVTFNYLSQATFFWMLVEGLYLHTMIVWTLLLVQLKFWHYCFIGWGIPFVITAMWILASALNDETTTICWLPENVWKLDYILLVPIFIVLLINLMFLVSIVWVLITKLRSSYPGQNGLYKKATKATLILFPLLGMTYLLFLWAPKENNFFWYISAIMHSTQGLFVSVVYCFLNSEVRKVLKKYIKRWKDHKNPTGRLDSAQSSRKLPRKSFKMNSLFGFGGKKTTTAVKEEQARKPSSLKLSSSKSSLRTCQYNQMGCKKKITPKKKVSFHLEPINSCRNNNEFYKMKKYSSKKSVPVEEDFEINLESLSARSLPFFHVGYSARNS